MLLTAVLKQNYLTIYATDNSVIFCFGMSTAGIKNTVPKQVAIKLKKFQLPFLVEKLLAIQPFSHPLLFNYPGHWATLGN